MRYQSRDTNSCVGGNWDGWTTALFSSWKENGLKMSHWKSWVLIDCYESAAIECFNWTTDQSSVATWDGHQRTLWHQTWRPVTCDNCYKKMQTYSAKVVLQYSPEAAIHNFFQHWTSKRGLRAREKKQCCVHAVWASACCSVFRVCVHISTTSGKLAVAAKSCMQRRE